MKADCTCTMGPYNSKGMILDDVLVAFTLDTDSRVCTRVKTGRMVQWDKSSRLPNQNYLAHFCRQPQGEQIQRGRSCED